MAVDRCGRDTGIRADEMIRTPLVFLIANGAAPGTSQRIPARLRLPHPFLPAGKRVGEAFVRRHPAPGVGAAAGSERGHEGVAPHDPWRPG